MKRLAFLAAVVLLIGFGPFAPPARAGSTMTLLEQNGSVVASGSGKFDLTDLTNTFQTSVRANIFPSDGIIETGPAVERPIRLLGGTTGPSTFGSGGFTNASSGSGDLVGVFDHASQLVVPLEYNSGDPLSGGAVWDNTTFAGLGVTPGTYVWTWGTGDHADSFTLQVGPATAAIPEPSSLTLLGVTAAGLLGYAWRRRR
jgi:hypothetical protein